MATDPYAPVNPEDDENSPEKKAARLKAQGGPNNGYPTGPANPPINPNQPMNNGQPQTTAPDVTNMPVPTPGAPATQSKDPSAPGYVAPAGSPANTSWKGGGWDQFATDPKSFQSGLAAAFAQGKRGEDAIAWMDQNGWKGAQNPAGGGVAYYADSNSFGLPGGYKVVPGANGTSDIYQVEGSVFSPTAKINRGSPSTVSGDPSGVGTTTTDPGGSPGGANPATPPASPSTQSRSDQLYQMLLDRATQGENVDPNDPVIREQVDAYSGAQQNQARNTLAALAEKGGGSNNMSAEQRLAGEQTGQAVSGFQATLLTRELTAKRDEIQNALTSMQAYLTDEQQRELQKQIAEMNNAIEMARIRSSDSQFDRSLGQRAYEFDADLQQRILGN